MGLLSDIREIREDQAKVLSGQAAILTELQKLNATADAAAVDLHFIAEEIRKATSEVVGINVELNKPTTH